MCGIVGLIVKGDTGLIQKHEDVFRNMLYADAVRGFDSTGVIGVNKYGDFGIMKEAVQASVFLPKLEASELWKEMWTRGKAWIGHNRKKTIGDIADETAHPFVVDNEFAMVHNGTLTGWRQLHKDAVTDSAALAHVLKKAFDQDDWKTALEEALGEVWGAYAVAIYDQKRSKVYLLRNKERPLCRIEADDAHYFASEGMMAQWILARNNYQLDKLKIVPIEEHKLHIYDMDKGMWTTEDISPKKCSVVQETPSCSRTTNNGVFTSGNRKAVNPSSFKHIKRGLLGKSIDFWIDTHFEANMPRTLDDGETEICFFAQSDDVKWNHTVFGDMDLAKFHMKTEDDIYENKWKGTIDLVELNEKGNELHITLVDVKPYIKSSDLQTFFKRQLENKPLTVLRQELAERGHKLTDWQTDLYNEIIALKVKQVQALEKSLAAAGAGEGHDAASLSAKTMDDLKKVQFLTMRAALNAAKERGVEVAFKLEDGKHIWFDKKTGETIHESTASLIH